jgi:hypothetical protein
MATHDVPGAKPGNRDQLAMGCWAEHEDRSLIFVESTEGGNVVYSVFDVARDPPLEFRDAMREGEFKAAFSWPNKVGEKWTWHDKTPFPWDRVMRDFPAGTRVASAGALTTAAQRIAERLGLRGRNFERDRYAHLADEVRAAGGIIDRLQRAIDRLRP